MPAPERVVSDDPLQTWEYDEIPWMEVKRVGSALTVGGNRNVVFLCKAGADKPNTFALILAVLVV